MKEQDMQRVPRFAFLLLAIIGAVLVSCSDDEESSPTASNPATVIAGWEVVSGHEAEYIVFRANNVVDYLYEYDFGFRAGYSSMYLVRGRQMLMEGEGFPVYNYAIDGDTLRLMSPQNTIKLARDASAPTADEWVTPVTPSQEFSAPLNEPLDMAWDGLDLWYGNARESDYIYRINTSSGAVLDSVAVPYEAWTLVWAGSDLWLSHASWMTIMNYDTLSGTTTQTSPSVGNWVKGLAWDGQYLWVGSDGARAVYQYDPSSNTILDTLQLDQPITGMTWANGDLYVCSNGLINLVEISPLRVAAVYRVPGWDAQGIAFDGAHFWVSLRSWPDVEIARIDL
jgi:hypothetical protein